MSLPGHQSALQQLRRQLAGNQIQAVGRKIIPTPFSTLNSLLPQEGIPTGALIEWVSDAEGVGATSVALKCAAPFLGHPGAMVVVDPQHEFHAASVEHLGISLSRILLVRPERRAGEERSAVGRTRMESLWALEQSARCGGVRMVLTWVDRLSSTAQRRLQLAVERSGVTIFLIRPLQALRQNSWADLRFYIQSDTKTVSAQRIRVSLTRSKNALLHRGAATLEYDDETGDVSSVSELAGSATGASAT